MERATECFGYGHPRLHNAGRIEDMCWVRRTLGLLHIGSGLGVGGSSTGCQLRDRVNAWVDRGHHVRRLWLHMPHLLLPLLHLLRLRIRRGSLLVLLLLLLSSDRLGTAVVPHQECKTLVQRRLESRLGRRRSLARRRVHRTAGSLRCWTAVDGVDQEEEQQQQRRSNWSTLLLLLVVSDDDDDGWSRTNRRSLV